MENKREENKQQRQLNKKKDRKIDDFHIKEVAIFFRLKNHKVIICFRRK